jgi:hypothetical protein
MMESYSARTGFFNHAGNDPIIGGSSLKKGARLVEKILAPFWI